MSFDPEAQWPDLFAQLDPKQRQDLNAALYSQYLEGAQWDRESVADLVDFMTGEITAEQHTKRVVQRKDLLEELG